MESAHLFTYPLVELGDVTLKNQQLTLGLYQHFLYVHGGCRVTDPGEDDDLLEERRRYQYVGDQIHVRVEQDCCSELVGQRVGQEIVEDVIVLAITRRRVDIHSCMRPSVLQGHLPVRGESVSRHPIVDWHCDEAMSIKPSSPVAHTGQEHGQVIRLPIKLFLEWCDGLVVELCGCGPSIGVVVVQDCMRASWSQCKRWWCRGCWHYQWCRWWSG